MPEMSVFTNESFDVMKEIRDAGLEEYQNGEEKPSVLAKPRFKKYEDRSHLDRRMCNLRLRSGRVSLSFWSIHFMTKFFHRFMYSMNTGLKSTLSRCSTLNGGLCGW